MVGIANLRGLRMSLGFHAACLAFAVVCASCRPPVPESSESSSQDHEALRTIEQELGECRNELEAFRLRHAAEVEGLEERIRVLEDTPSLRLNRAAVALSESRLEDAEGVLRELIISFPEAAETQRAQELLEEIESQREAERAEQAAEREEELRQQREGYRGLELERTPEVAHMTLHIREAEGRNRWVFDRHGSRYYHREARRGRRWLVVDFDAQAEAGDPVLPPIYAYRLNDTTLRLLGRLRVEFYRWQDYGAYLGNYHDPRNDFAYEDSVRLTAGIELDEDTFEDIVFVLAADYPCLVRVQERFANPPVRYEDDGCPDTEELNLAQVRSNYRVVEVLNRRQLR